MNGRTHSVLTATRLTPGERALVDAAAKLEALSVKDFIRSVLLPAVAERVAREAATFGGESGAA